MWKKNDVWCFARLSTNICLLECFPSLTWKILSAANFVSFVYLDVFCLTPFYFDKYLPFILTFVAIWPFGNLCIDVLTSASTAKFYFSLTKSYWKSKTFTYDHYNFCAHLFGTSITLLQLLISLKKRLWELLEHPSITSILKEIVLVKILGNFSVKHSFWNPLYKYICRLEKRESFNRGAGKGWLLNCFFFLF